MTAMKSLGDLGRAISPASEPEKKRKKDTPMVTPIEARKLVERHFAGSQAEAAKALGLSPGYFSTVFSRDEIPLRVEISCAMYSEVEELKSKLSEAESGSRRRCILVVTAPAAEEATLTKVITSLGGSVTSL